MRWEGHAQSAKNKGRLPWEAPHELALIKYSEVSCDVVLYWAQPLKLNLTWDAKVDGVTVQHTAQYFPDAERLFADGRSQIVETKTDYSDTIRDLAYFEKLLVAKAALAMFSYDFLLVSAAEDFSDRNTNNSVNLVYLDRHALLETEDRLRLANFMAGSSGKSTYEEVCLALHKPDKLGGLPVDKVHAAIVRRLIGYDANLPITPTTEIWSIAPLPPGIATPNTPRPTIQLWSERMEVSL